MIVFLNCFKKKTNLKKKKTPTFSSLRCQSSSISIHLTLHSALNNNIDQLSPYQWFLFVWWMFGFHWNRTVTQRFCLETNLNKPVLLFFFKFLQSRQILHHRLWIQSILLSLAPKTFLRNRVEWWQSCTWILKKWPTQKNGNGGCHLVERLALHMVYHFAPTDRRGARWKGNFDDAMSANKKVQRFRNKFIDRFNIAMKGTGVAQFFFYKKNTIANRCPPNKKDVVRRIKKRKRCKTKTNKFPQNKVKITYNLIRRAWIMVVLSS